MSQYQALVLGASGAIGSAFVSHFQNDAACSLVVGLSRQSDLHFDLETTLPHFGSKVWKKEATLS